MLPCPVSSGLLHRTYDYGLGHLLLLLLCAVRLHHQRQQRRRRAGWIRDSQEPAAFSGLSPSMQRQASWCPGGRLCSPRPPSQLQQPEQCEDALRVFWCVFVCWRWVGFLYFREARVDNTQVSGKSVLHTEVPSTLRPWTLLPPSLSLLHNQGP